MSPMRKRKQVEAGDGSYGGSVLSAFDSIAKFSANPRPTYGEACKAAEIERQMQSEGITQEELSIEAWRKDI